MPCACCGKCCPSNAVADGTLLVEIAVPGVEEQWQELSSPYGYYPTGRLGSNRGLSYGSPYSSVGYSYEEGANCTFSVTARVDCVDPECNDKWQYCIDNDAGVGDNLFNLECDTYPEINPCITTDYLYNCPIWAEVTWTFRYFCRNGQMVVEDVGEPVVTRSEPYSPCGTYECDLPPKPEVTAVALSSLSQCDCGPEPCVTASDCPNYQLPCEEVYPDYPYNCCDGVCKPYACYPGATITLQFRRKVGCQETTGFLGQVADNEEFVLAISGGAIYDCQDSAFVQSAPCLTQWTLSTGCDVTDLTFDGTVSSVCEQCYEFLGWSSCRNACNGSCP